MCEINCAIDTFLPLQTIWKHPSGQLTKKIKNCIYKRQIAFTRHGKDSLSFKYWRNKREKNRPNITIITIESQSCWREIKAKMLERNKTTFWSGYKTRAPYVPEHLLVTQHEVYSALSSINTSKAVGPDNIPNKLLKDFAFELAGNTGDLQPIPKRRKHPIASEVFHRQPYPQSDPPPHPLEEGGQRLKT